MKLTPLRNKILVSLDPDNKKIGTLWRPDMQYISYCKDCPSTDPKVRCVPEEIWEDDWKRNRMVPVAIRTEHNIVTVTRELAPSNVRIGEIIATGRLVKYAEPGMRVMIPLLAGGTTENIRVVSEDTILAMVEA